MQTKKTSVTTVVLVFIVLVATVVIGFQMIEIKRLKESQFGFNPGESLPALELVGMDNTMVDTASLSEGVSLIFCFKTPCSSCNSNLSAWKNLFQYFGGKVQVLGIVPDSDPGAFQLVEDKTVNFPLYIPVDKDSLRRRMRLKFNMAQTIVIFDNKIKTVKFGDLSGDDLRTLVTQITEMLKS